MDMVNGQMAKGKQRTPPVSLEVVKHDAVPRSFGTTNAVLPLVVEVVLVDGEEGQVRLASAQAFPRREP